MKNLILGFVLLLSFFLMQKQLPGLKLGQQAVDCGRNARCTCSDVQFLPGRAFDI